MKDLEFYPKPITVSTRKLPRKNVGLKERELLIKSIKESSECFLCGYKRCSRALHFHHKVPSEKSFSICQSNIADSLEEVKKEILKCVVLCSNCHSELHAGLFELI